MAAKLFKKNQYLILYGGLILFVGVALVGAWDAGVRHQALKTRGYLIREGTQQLTNPLLGCEITDQKEFKEFASLEKNVTRLINRNIADRKATSISFYFRALNSGRWVGINEDEKYDPASLLKVPLMIAYFKAAESDPPVLAKKIIYHTDPAVDQALDNVSPDNHLKENLAYTVDELLRQMIVQSDNIALYLLEKNLDPNFLREVFSDLGITSSRESGSDAYLISARTYFQFFRVLYNATYLTRLMSQKTLGILSHTNFKYGLIRLLPPELTVAHKFGVTSVRAGGIVQSRELHDCGIIYYPRHPYFLCLMTRGSDFDTLAATIADISRLVYHEASVFFTEQDLAQ